jgi:hypothetical protein
MSIFRSTLSLLLIHAAMATGCGAASRASIEALYEQLSFIRFGSFTPSTLPRNRPANYQPAEMLPKVHSWLTPGSGLYYATLDQYRYAVLKPIPPKVFREILEATYPDETHTGFAILGAKFWREVEQLQREGFTVGFVAEAPQEIVGIYYSMHKFIGFDIFANEATLLHERRHHQQHEDQARRERSRRTKTWFGWRDPISWIPQACLDSAGSYFGELDSTTQQLSSWMAVISQLPVMPKDLSQARRIDAMHMLTIPQLLSSNLEYPVSAADWIIRQEACPSELRHAAEELKIELTRQKLSVANDTLSKLNFLRGRAIRLMTDGESSAEVARQIETHKSEVVRNLEAVVVIRSAEIRRILNRLDDELRHELCERAGGFAFLADCPEKVPEKVEE